MNIGEQLKKAHLPIGLFSAALKDEVPSEFAGKFKKVTALMTENKSLKVVIVYGSDSPDKDIFCACLMKWYMIHFHKTGEWVSPPKDRMEYDTGRRGITVFPAIDIYTPQNAKLLASVLRDWVPRGRAFVLCSQEEKELRAVLGGPIMEYLHKIAIVVPLPVAITNPITLE